MTRSQDTAARFYAHPGSRPRIEAHVAKLNRRLAAAGSETQPLTAAFTTEVVAADGDPVGTEVLVIDLSWTVSAAGWTLAGVITPTDDRQSFTYQGLTLGAEEITAADLMLCDHCQTRRARKRLFVITDDHGNRMQVGSTCLRPHTGLSATAGVLSLLSADLADLLAEVAEPAEGRGADSWARERGGPACWPTDYLLGLGLYALPLWRNRAPGLSHMNLADYLEAELERPRDADALVAAHRDEIAAITDHAAAQAPGNDYWTNVAAALSSETTGAQHYRLVLSAVSSWARDRAKAETAAQIAQEPWAAAGTKLKEQPVEVTLQRVATFETFFTYDGEIQHVYTFLTDAGHMLVWKTQARITGPDGEAVWASGSRLRLIGGTVKAAEEYRGDVQTPISRVKYEVLSRPGAEA